MKYKELILKEFKNNHILEAKYFLDKFPSWDKSTIYRNLERLEKSEEIHRVESFDGVNRYELNDNCSHLHKVCQSCGNIEEIETNKQHVLEVLNIEKTQNPTVTVTTKDCEVCEEFQTIT